MIFFLIININQSIYKKRKKVISGSPRTGQRCYGGGHFFGHDVSSHVGRSHVG
jgi:hypothetical protein